MYILGVSFDYHDSAAALICGEKVLAAAHEDRFSRVKGDSSFPKRAIDFCLQQAGIKSNELDFVVYYENPLKKFERIVKTSIRSLPKGAHYLKETVQDWIASGKFEPRERIHSYLKIDSSKVIYGNHHRSHAASAFFCSPFEEAAIVTLDGVGESETATINVGKANSIEKIGAVEFPHSLGLFYSAFTAYAGFQVNEGEYKLMGMAAFAEPSYLQKMRSFFRLCPDGRFRVDQRPFKFMTSDEMPFNPYLEQLFGCCRPPESTFDPRGGKTTESQEARRHAGIAASVQKVTEEVVLHVVRQAMRRTGLKNVCLAGGVALNCVANSRIVSELGCQLYVHPDAGDAGAALGAALAYYYLDLKQQRKIAPLNDPYLGLSVDEKIVKKAFEVAFLKPDEHYEDEQKLVTDIAKRLAEGQVVGWMQGRAEWGPRALGNRSILANPTRTDMQKIVNEKIKYREPFRPFAPSVLKDRASEFFELGDINDAGPEHFMLSVVKVRESAKAKIPAVTHIDGTARVHLVDKNTNPLFYSLIQQFGVITGIPVLLNTSFNLRGEPVVNSPEDAIKTFQWSNMDCLVIGRYLINSENNV